MRSDETFAYEEEERDSDLLDRHTTRHAELTNHAARHHLIGGFNRRLLMLAAARRVIERITHSPVNEPIGVDQAIELAIQLNAYYLNLCGALDNLAWVMQYEWNLLPGVSETSKGRNGCGLFAGPFAGALAIARPNMAKELARHRNWYSELKKLRDPAAHRVPLYAIPGYLTEEDAIEYRRLEALGLEKGRAGDHYGMMELIHRATLLGGYEPLMSIWTPEGERLVNAWHAVLRDHYQFQIIAGLISYTIFPRE